VASVKVVLIKAVNFKDGVSHKESEYFEFIGICRDHFERKYRGGFIRVCKEYLLG
jgi:hypothetical protein